MEEPSSSRPGCGQWLLLLAVALWLAAVPPAVTLTLSVAINRPPDTLTTFGLVASGTAALPNWAFALLTTGLTLGLYLMAFVPVYLAARRPGRELLRTTATLALVIALFQTINAVARLLGPEVGPTTFGPGTSERAITAALRLALILPFLLLGVPVLAARLRDRVETHRHRGSLLKVWQRAGLRLWLNSSAWWLALACGAAIVWPWVLVGSLGSVGTTAANALQALPNALGEEILFRGFALAWLWRAARNRTGAAAGSLLLFVAAQGGTVLPYGDWGALLRFVAALGLGLLATELTARAGGSIWPAVALHFLYDWFRLAFVDPRSQTEILHWLVQVWAPLAAGGLGLLLWGGRKVVELLRTHATAGPSLGGTLTAAGLASLGWAGVVALYLTLGIPGFHPDGFLIILDEQADLRPAAAIADPVERRAWVYRTLTETAERSQAPLRAELDRQGVPYRPHYLINMIEVLDRPGLRRTFARKPGVAMVLFQAGVRRYAHPFQIPAADVSGPRGVEWNVREVGADRLWELGYIGQGVIVGSADTGVAWDHPALKAAYLGWDGNAADHNYHWFDPWDNSPVPWDDNGHGTHTTGTMVGQDGENQIGLAPGARWIACRNMRHGIGNPGSYVSCMEFLLVPFPLGGDPFHDGDPARGAHVVNNSWGCPAREGCLPDTLRLAVDHLRAAGQMMVASAGNEGPGCSTVQDPPALYDSVLSVGAIEQGDRVATFSSRGPVAADGSQRLKPDIVAPGVDIRSAVPGGYTSSEGTSMAGPHVAGAVALLWSARPELMGDPDRTEALLIETAQPLTPDTVCSTAPNWLAQLGGAGVLVVCACGGDGPDSVPNNIYGWGQVDVWAAVHK